MKKFSDWFYWNGTRWMLIIYPIVATIITLWLEDWLIIPLLLSLIPYWEWLKYYEKKYKKSIDKSEKVDYNKDKIKEITHKPPK